MRYILLILLLSALLISEDNQCSRDSKFCCDLIKQRRIDFDSRTNQGWMRSIQRGDFKNDPQVSQCIENHINSKINNGVIGNILSERNQ